MAKFITNVAGTTFHNVNFAMISKSSKVDLVPDPNCPYDKHAVRVLVNGIQVGYIPKKQRLNETFSKAILNGYNVKARIRSIVGGTGHKRHGIFLDVITDDQFTAERCEPSYEPKKSKSGGVIQRHYLEGISYFRSNLIIELKYNREELWVKFLEDELKLPKLLELPKEPDYDELYRQSFTWAQRLFRANYRPFRNLKKRAWSLEFEQKTKNNEEREKLLFEFKNKKPIYESRFSQFSDKLRLQALFLKLKISQSFSRPRDEPSRYTTIYQKALFNAIADNFRSCGSEVSVAGKQVDIFGISRDLNSAWAIEVDGGIHNEDWKAENDRNTEEILHKNGVSLIRVPNRMVSADIGRTADLIKKIINVLVVGPF